MGGRGSYSTSGKGRSADGYLTNLGGAPDRRPDIQKAFLDELGFSEITGTNGLDTAVLGAYAIGLNELERKYGAIAASTEPKFTTGNGTAKAAVFWDINHPDQQMMAINSDQMGTIKANLRGQRDSEKSGWHALTDGKITRQAMYTIAHEYGHMVANALAAKAGMSASRFCAMAEREIRAMVKKRHGSDNPSTYGAKNEYEFFAESFASLESGKPNHYGEAMGEWLKKHKLR